MTLPTLTVSLALALGGVAAAAGPDGAPHALFPSTISTKKGGKNKKRSKKKKKKKRTDTPFESSDVLLTAGAFGSAVSMREAAWVLPPDAGPEDAEWQACEQDPNCDITDSDNNAAGGFGYGWDLGIWRANALDYPGLNLGVYYRRDASVLEGQTHMVPVDKGSTSVFQQYEADKATYDVKLNTINLGVLFQPWLARGSRVYGQVRFGLGGGWTQVSTVRDAKPNKVAEGTMGAIGLLDLDLGIGVRIGKHLGLTVLPVGLRLLTGRPNSHPADYMPFLDEDGATQWRFRMGAQMTVAL